MPSTVIKSDEFMAWWNAKEFPQTADPITVHGDLTIKGTEILPKKALHLENMTFTGSVRITDYAFEKSSLVIHDCHFFESLKFDDVKTDHFSIAKIKARHLVFWRCVAETTVINRAEIESALDISGLRLSKDIVLGEIKVERLELFNPRVFHIFNAEHAVTNDTVFARQFELARIPVFVSTEAVREWLYPTRHREVEC
ncbi:MAG: hypothetical protein RLZZ347_779 [Candidatus Parcubacteria bacterium]|jgi:hypothetical protein